MDDEEEIYMFPWNDPKNAEKKYTEQEIRELASFVSNQDELIEYLRNQGRIEEAPNSEVKQEAAKMETPNNSYDEEEIYLVPWDDPKNAGKTYSRTEAEEVLKGFSNREEVIGELIEKGIVVLTDDEKLDDINKEFETFDDDLRLTPAQKFRKNTANVEDLNNLTRDDKLDLYFDSLVDNDYDVKGYEMVNEMLDNINYLKDLISSDFQTQEGKWAELNRQLQNYSLNNLEDLYSYMIESTMPAMETIKKLTQCLAKRSKVQYDIIPVQRLYDMKLEDEPPKEILMYFAEGYIDAGGFLRDPPGWRNVKNPSYYGWQQELQKLWDELQALKKEFEELSQEAEEYLKEIEEYSNINLVFRNTFYY